MQRSAYRRVQRRPERGAVSQPKGPPSEPPRPRSCDRVGEICGGEVDHRRATDGQHDSQNQPTLVNDDTPWNPWELRVFNGNQQRSITVRWHSQGGSAGSNPVGATPITAGQRRYGAGCGHRWGCLFCPWATAAQQQLRLVSQSWRSVRAASSRESKVLSLGTGAVGVGEADTWTDKISTARSGTTTVT